MPSCFESDSNDNVQAAVNLHVHSFKCTTVFILKYFSINVNEQGMLYPCVLCFIPSMLVTTQGAIGPQRVL